MSKVLTRKPLVEAMIKARRTAIMGAAATAIIATSPAFAATSADRATIEALPTIPGINAVVVISNDEDITVGGDQAALGHQATEDDVDLVNSGDLAGGIGIDVSTGAVDFGSALFDETVASAYGINYMPLYDDAGNPVLSPYGYALWVATGQLTVNARTTILARDPLASTITIENSGAIAFSGAAGIRATNPAGASILIRNSGDIAATQDTTGRSGIHASTDSSSATVGEPIQTAEGQFTYNAYGQLTGVVAPDEFTADDHLVDMEYDGGAIVIENSGDIDMGVVAANPGFRTRASTGIYARGDGGTTIVNSGDINVDRWSSGIHVATTAATTIANSGDITIGNGSTGISLTTSDGSVGYYRLGGDVYILNTGDIRGGTTLDEAAPGDYVVSTGIDVLALGSNNESLAILAHYNEKYAAYNEMLGEEAYALFEVPNLRLYSTTVVNSGDLELGDLGTGIRIAQAAGDSTAINEGTIQVGNGRSYVQYGQRFASAGILQSNGQFSGRGSTTSINAATGVIIAGDDSIGIGNYNYAGDSVAINQGSITIGDGVSGRVTNYAGETYDRMFHSVGILSASSARAMGTTAYALNAGSIAVGELAVGSMVAGNGIHVLNPAEPTAINVNEGIITTGDNSSGMLAFGSNATTYNAGSITTGTYDVSGYTLPAEDDFQFSTLKYGASAMGEYLAEVINVGSITTGDGTIGASARMRYVGEGVASRVLQGGDGVITTGDDAIGARVAGHYEAVLVNEGRVAVGDRSIGAELTAGSVVLHAYEMTATVVEGAVFAANAGIIETGDDSVGLRLAAVLEDVPYSATFYVWHDDPPHFELVEVNGTADSVGSAYLVNSGTIRVGARSTAVEITGRAGTGQGLHLFNTGVIEAGPGSTALDINAANGLGSLAVNAGTISGDIVLGDGNDRLVNTRFVDRFGRIVSTGNLVMNDSTIDFGAGENRFENDHGVITIAGGDNLIIGADLFMTQARLDARNGLTGSRLTIDGNLSGSFTFGADVSRVGADQLMITGNVADGSAMGILLNPVEQLRGETEFAVITVGGENRAGEPVFAGVGGEFADSLLDAQARFDAATGQVLVKARFGMGHLATAAAATTTLAQGWWLQAAGSFAKRSMHRLAGADDTGISVWGSAFQEDATITPGNALQDTGFDQKLSGLQSGIQWTTEVGGGSLSVAPVFTYGDARASLNANPGNASGDAWAYGLNASYVLGNGLYVDATWQDMTMEVDLRAPGTVSQATGRTDASGNGYNLEAGYAWSMKNGFTLAPQVQYASVKVELDDFASSNGVHEFTEAGGRYTLLRAGVSVFKTFETRHGSVAPLAEIDYLDSLDSDSELRSNGLGFANDTSGSGYRVEFGLAARYKAWDISGRVGLTDTTVSDQALSTNLTLRYRW